MVLNRNGTVSSLEPEPRNGSSSNRREMNARVGDPSGSADGPFVSSHNGTRDAVSACPVQTHLLRDRRAADLVLFQDTDRTVELKLGTLAAVLLRDQDSLVGGMDVD